MRSDLRRPSLKSLCISRGLGHAKIVISSIGIVSLLVIPVAAQENDVKKAAQTLENLVVSEIQTKVETEARELENDTLKVWMSTFL